MDLMTDPRESKKSIPLVVIRESILEGQLINIDYLSIRELAANKQCQLVVKAVQLKRKSMVNGAHQSERVRDIVNQSRIHVRNLVHEEGFQVQALKMISSFNKASLIKQTKDLVCIFLNRKIRIQYKNQVKKSHLFKFLIIRRVMNLFKMFWTKGRQEVSQSKSIP